MHRTALSRGQRVTCPLIYFWSRLFPPWAGRPCNPAGRVKVAKFQPIQNGAFWPSPYDPWVGTGQPILPALVPWATGPWRRAAVPFHGPRIRQVPGGLSPGNSISKSPVALTKSARFLQDIVMHICEVVEEEVVGVSIGLMMEF